MTMLLCLRLSHNKQERCGYLQPNSAVLYMQVQLYQNKKSDAKNRAQNLYGALYTGDFSFGRKSFLARKMGRSTP